MKWTKEKPTYAEYYWAMPIDPDGWLDGSPEIVKVYYDGKWMVFRPGMKGVFTLDDFTYWSDKHIDMPDKKGIII